MTQLAFVANRQQWESLAASVERKALPTVVCADIDLALELRANDIPVVGFFDYMDDGDPFECRDTAYGLAESVAGECKGMWCVDGVDVLAECAYDAVHAISGLLFSRRLADRVICDLGPEAVWCFGETSDFALWDPPCPSPDAFNLAVAAVARTAEIQITSLVESGRDDRRYGAFPWVPRTERAAEIVIDGADTIEGISFCPGQTSVEQMAFLESLPKCERRKWLLVTDSVPLDGFNSLRPIDLRMACFAEPDEMTKSGAAAAAFRASLRRKLSGTLDDGAAETFAAGLTAALQPVWRDGARMTRSAAVLGRLVRPRVLLSCQDIAGPTRCLISGLAAVGVPCISVAHSGAGTIGPARRSAGAQAHLSVWGAADVELHRRWRQKGAEIRAIGPLRSDMAGLLKPRTQEQPAAKHADSRLHVLLLTSRVSSPYAATVSAKRLVEEWKSLAGCFARHPSWEVGLRPHPRYDYGHLYQDFSAALDGRVATMEGKSLAESLAWADIAVICECRTTAALDCIAAGVPTIYLRGASIRHPDLEWAVQRAISTTESVEELEVLCERLAGDVTFREETCRRASAFLPELLCASGVAAGARMGAFIADVGLPAACSNHGGAILLAMLFPGRAEVTGSRDGSGAVQTALQELPDLSPEVAGKVAENTLGHVASGSLRVRRLQVVQMFRYAPRCRGRLHLVRKALAESCLFDGHNCRFGMALRIGGLLLDPVRLARYRAGAGSGTSGEARV